MSPAKNIVMQSEFKIVSISVSNFFFLQEANVIVLVRYDVGPRSEEQNRPFTFSVHVQ